MSRIEQNGYRGTGMRCWVFMMLVSGFMFFPSCSLDSIADALVNDPSVHHVNITMGKYTYAKDYRKWSNDDLICYYSGDDSIPSFGMVFRVWVRPVKDNQPFSRLYFYFGLRSDDQGRKKNVPYSFPVPEGDHYDCFFYLDASPPDSVETYVHFLVKEGRVTFYDHPENYLFDGSFEMTVSPIDHPDQEISVKGDFYEPKGYQDSPFSEEVWSGYRSWALSYE